MSTDTRYHFTTSVPLVIPGVIERAAWRDAEPSWLREAERELHRGAEPNTVQLEGGRIETTIEILRAGEYVHRQQGRFEIGDRVLDQIVANFAADSHMGGHGHEVFITLGHVKGYDGQPAAGWIKDVWRLGDSVFARVNLNPKTVAAMKEGEWKYFSPDFWTDGWTDEAGRLVGAKLLSGAITNFPFLKGMAPFQLSALLGDAGDDEMSLTPEQLKQVQQVVTEQVTALGTQLKDAVATQVGTAVKAQLADAAKEITKSVTDAVKPKDASSGGPDLKQLADTVTGLQGTLTKALDENKRLSDALASTNEGIEARDITELCRKALSDGKMTAGEIPGFGTAQWDAQKWMKEDGRFATVANLRTHIAKAPVVVKLADHSGGNGANADGGASSGKKLTLSDAEAQRIGFKDAKEFEALAEAHDADAA